jgi:lipid-binding SYLF domain-containing protein
MALGTLDSGAPTFGPRYGQGVRRYTEGKNTWISPPPYLGILGIQGTQVPLEVPRVVDIEPR